MCGITGYIGNDQLAKQLILDGLRRLEYRGYDSAGIALGGETLEVVKRVGRVERLAEALERVEESTVGVGHTRWATHGKPTEQNAHPHVSADGRFALVHNGVIENAEALKQQYVADVEFTSTTDTEVIVQLLGKFVADGLDVSDAFQKTIQLLKGSYAIVCLDRQNQQTLYVAKNKSPLVIAFAENSTMVASDEMAVSDRCHSALQLEDGELAIIQPTCHTLRTLQGERIDREPYKLQVESMTFDQGSYAHYMLKEIEEQPNVVCGLAREYMNMHGQIELPLHLSEQLANASRIAIVACGTSYHAGLVGKELFERLAQIPVTVHYASEFNYYTPLIEDGTLFIFISQSGETADSIAALKKCRANDWPTLALVNVKHSTMAKLADDVLLLHAGTEVAVASTKAYVAQVTLLSLIAGSLGRLSGMYETFDMTKQLAIVQYVMYEAFQMQSLIRQTANQFVDAKNVFILGRGLDYAIAQEAALKIKEVTYIQAEAYPSGELKHGPIALIEDETPVIAIISNKRTADQVRSNIAEVEARGARVYVLSSEGLEQPTDWLTLPATHPLFSPLAMIVPLQLLSYEIAQAKGLDVDKPRNLAKSVTVE